MRTAAAGDVDELVVIGCLRARRRPPRGPDGIDGGDQRVVVEDVGGLRQGALQPGERPPRALVALRGEVGLAVGEAVAPAGLTRLLAGPPPRQPVGVLADGVLDPRRELAVGERRQPVGHRAGSPPWRSIAVATWWAPTSANDVPRVWAGLVTHTASPMARRPRGVSGPGRRSRLCSADIDDTSVVGDATSGSTHGAIVSMAAAARWKAAGSVRARMARSSGSTPNVTEKRAVVRREDEARVAVEAGTVGVARLSAVGSPSWSR